MNDLLPVVKDILITVLTGVLTASLPILVKYAVDWLVSKRGEVEALLSAEQREALAFVTKLAVTAAEQQKLAGLVKNKKDYAVKFATDWLAAQGYNVDVATIANAVESALWTEINQFNPAKNPAAK